MSYPVWPAGLTRFERSGWQVQRQDARQKRQGDGGPPGYRRRFSSAATVVQLALVVSRLERSVFDSFYEDTTAEGSGLFWMPDPASHGWGLATPTGAPLLIRPGMPLLLARRWLCSFGDPPPTEVIVEQVQFRKTFTVAVMP